MYDTNSQILTSFTADVVKVEYLIEVDKPINSISCKDITISGTLTSNV